MTAAQMCATLGPPSEKWHADSLAFTPQSAPSLSLREPWTPYLFQSSRPRVSLRLTSSHPEGHDQDVVLWSGEGAPHTKINTGMTILISFPDLSRPIPTITTLHKRENGPLPIFLGNQPNVDHFANSYSNLPGSGKYIKI
jgi:hypothetical protein